MQRKNKQVIMFFGAMYFLIIVTIPYLLFANVGLEIKEEYIGENLILIAENQSSRIIKNVEIYYMDELNEKQILKELEEMQPLQKEIINLDPIKNKYARTTIMLDADFYNPAKKELRFSVKSATIYYVIDAPKKAITQTEIKTKVQVCNGNKTLTEMIQIETKTDEKIENLSKTKIIQLGANGCEEIEFKYRTKEQKGNTKIIFNINTQNTTRQEEVVIEII